MFNALRSRHRRRRVIVAMCGGFALLSVFLLIFSTKFTEDTPLLQDALQAPAGQEVAGEFAAIAHFNAEPGAESVIPLLAAAIDEARHSVRLVMFSFEAEPIAAALQAAHARGVDVTVILDKSNHRRHRWFLKRYPDIDVVEAGFEPPDPKSFMHHKFLLIDEESPQGRLFYGSLNYTVLQESIDPSFILETRDPAFIAQFSAEVERLRNGFSGRGKFRTEYRPWAETLRFANGWLEVWFSPGFRENSAKTRFIELIEAAQSSIDVAIWVLTDADIVRALRDRSADGVRVRVIADNAFFWGPDSALPLFAEADREHPELPLEILSDSWRTLEHLSRQAVPNTPGHTSYLHQHLIIIDQVILITGTSNWSDKAFYENDESIIITNIPAVVQSFTGWWERQYEALRGEELRFAWVDDNMQLDSEQIAAAQSLRIYTEPTAFGENPTLCYEVSGEELRTLLRVPEVCRSMRNHAFLTNVAGDIIAAAYL